MSRKDYGKVSVIVPVYNVEKYLAKCLDSILAQTYTNIEIIVVDDGAKDNSGAICDAYAKKDERIMVIHQQNKGLSGARNTGIDAATGEYIYFVDSDDWIDEKLLEDNLKLLVEENADIVCFNSYIVYQDGVKKWQDFKEIFNQELLKLGMLRREICGCAWTMLYTKSIWEKNRYKEGVKFEDWYAVPEILAQCKTIACNSGCYYYYNKTNENSITATASVGSYYYELLCYEQLLRHLDNFSVLKNNLSAFANNKGFKMAMKILRYNLFAYKYPKEQIAEVREFIDNVSNLTVANKFAYWDYKTVNLYGVVKGLEYYFKLK